MSCAARLAVFTDELAAGTKTIAQLPFEVGALYRLGFQDGVATMRTKVEQAEQQADYWYERITYTDAEITEMRDRARDAWYQAWWDAGMPTDYPADLYPEQETTHA